MNFHDPILLVQAQSISAAAIRENLGNEAGTRIALEVVETLEQALRVLEQQVVAAILLDLDLPGTHELDGFIVLHLHAPHVPILVFAETVSAERGLAAVHAGAQDCLTRAEVESPLIGRALGYAIERQLIQAVTLSHAEQLQFSEARFRLLINENADAIVVVNRDGVVRFANPAAGALFAKPRAELVGTMLAITQADDGGRRMEDGRTTEDGGRTTEDGRRTTEDGRRTTEDGWRTTEDGGRTTEDERRKTEDG